MDDNRKTLLGRALGLEYFTITYNVIEAAIAVTVGALGNSVALIAFGMDSLIEVTASVILAWRLLVEYRGVAESEEEIERIERKASYWVGVTFFALGAYVLYESAENLMAHEPSYPGVLGTVLAGVSVVVMPVLWRMKLHIADRLGSNALRHEAAETIICAYLSVILLVGIVLNSLLGLWWADSAAALFMLYFIIKEGLEAFDEARGGCGCSCGKGGQGGNSCGG